MEKETVASSSDQQIDKLATWILGNCSEEIRDESAVEVAIRLIQECLMTRKKISKDLADLIQFKQKSQENEYLEGLYNGLILAQATLTGEVPEYVK